MSAERPVGHGAREGVWLVSELLPAHGLLACGQRLKATWVRRRLEADTRAELHRLDERGLRDLGLDRSQIPSVAAMVSGRSN